MGESIFAKFFNLFRKKKSKDSDDPDSIMQRYGIKADDVQTNPLYENGDAQARYGTEPGIVYSNPLFDATKAQELQTQKTAQQGSTEKKEETLTEKTAKSGGVALRNQLKNIGGMPTPESILMMIDAKDFGKLEKHKKFNNALTALKQYQDIMQRKQKASVNEEKMRRLGKYENAAAEVELAGKGDIVVDEAWLAMSEFIYQADLAVKGSTRLFAGRSGTVRKLAPVFANLLMQAYGLLPKLSHLESAIAPYLLDMKKAEEEYTLDEVLNHRVTGGRSGGLATRGPEENHVIILSPKEALDAVKSTRKESQSKSRKAMNAQGEKQIQEAEEKLQEAEEEIKQSEIKLNELREKNKDSKMSDSKATAEELTAWRSLEKKRREYLSLVNKRNDAIRAKRGSGLKDMQKLRADKTEKARMALTIPPIPDGVLSKRYRNAVSGEQKQLANKNAEEIATAYIAELRLRMTALQDVAESYEFTGETERAGVHDKQAEYFRLSRLLYRVTSNKDLLKKVILEGIMNIQDDKQTECQDIIALWRLGGKTLSTAVLKLNQWAQNPENYARLIDQDGKALQEDTKDEKKDYLVGGGATSISIIDRVNQRVLRAPKEQGNYLDDERQKHALNGIKDEAAGKVAQFLGFNVCAQAEARGFMAKKAGSDEETPVFGGSVMKMAKGINADKINLMMKAGDDSKVMQSDGKNQYQTLELMKQGRLIGDFMKLNVLDYIIQHGDRNAGNFLVNLEAGENESMITAIDNDMILGTDQARGIGEKSSAQALNGVNNKIFMDFGFKLQTAFPMMTKEVKDTLEKLDLQALSDLLMPYADRVVRLAAVHRAAELKEWAKKVPTCDLTTEEGTREYVKKVMEISMVEWVRGMNFVPGDELDCTLIKMLPNMLAKWIVEYSYGLGGKFAWKTEMDKIIRIMNIAGLSKEQAKKIFVENLSYSNIGDVAISEAEFNESKMGKMLEQYKWDESYVL